MGHLVFSSAGKLGFVIGLAFAMMTIPREAMAPPSRDFRSERVVWPEARAVRRERCRLPGYAGEGVDERLGCR